MNTPSENLEHDDAPKTPTIASSLPDAFWKIEKNRETIEKIVSKQLSAEELRQLIQDKDLANLLKRQQIPRDYQVLSDEVLVQTILQERPLNHTEYKALCASPWTLKRLEFLWGFYNWITSSKASPFMEAHSHWLSNIERKEESPNYKNLEAAQAILNREITDVQKAYILDETNEESVLWWPIFKEIEDESLRLIDDVGATKEQFEANNQRLDALYEEMTERADIYRTHLERMGEFTQKEISLLIRHGVLLSLKTRENAIKYVTKN